MKHYKIRITDIYQLVRVKTIKANSADEAFNKADFDRQNSSLPQVE